MVVPPFQLSQAGVDCDEVFPGILLGNGATLRKKEYLQKLGGCCVLEVCVGAGSHINVGVAIVLYVELVFVFVFVIVMF